MKKILLTTLIATGLVVSAMAQGTVNFLNFTQNGAGDFTFAQFIYGPNPSNSSEALHGSSAADVPSGSTVYAGAALQGARYVAELWGGPSSATDPSTLTLI